MIKPHIKQIVTDLKQTFKQTPFWTICWAIDPKRSAIMGDQRAAVKNRALARARFLA